MVDAAGSRATALVALLVRADAEVHTVVVAAPGTATAAVPPLPGAASGTVVAADALTDAAERIGAVVDRLFLVDLEHPDRCRTAFHAVLGADAVVVSADADSAPEDLLARGARSVGLRIDNPAADPRN